MIPDFTVSTFRGLNTPIKDLKTLEPGVASSTERKLNTCELDSLLYAPNGSALLNNVRCEAILNGRSRTTSWRFLDNADV